MRSLSGLLVEDECSEAAVEALEGFDFRKDDGAAGNDVDTEGVYFFSLCSLAKASSSIRRASSLPTTPFGCGTSSLNPFPLGVWAILSGGVSHKYNSFQVGVAQQFEESIFKHLKGKQNHQNFLVINCYW